MEKGGWSPWWENGRGKAGSGSSQGNASQTCLLSIKLSIHHHSAVVLVLCLKWHPLSSVNLSESRREDFFLMLRKIYYFFWMTKDVFRVQTFGSGDLVSNLMEFGLKGYTQWIHSVGQINGTVHSFCFSPPCLWSTGWVASMTRACFPLGSLSCFPCLIPSSAFSVNR